MSVSLILLFPLLGFLFNGTNYLLGASRGKSASVNLAGIVATLAMFCSFLVSITLFLNLKHMAGAEQGVQETLFSWMTLGSLNINFALRFDSLSSIFTLVITGVGALIHLYSISYMHDDKGGAKYFAYLNLFCFMMLNLVLGSNLPHVFLGWEGVGLASYLLIGFWYQDPEKFKAGQKAFVMNRIGDVGFLIAMFTAFKYAGTLDLVALIPGSLSPHFTMVFGLLIFLACTGKSAQIPLFTWLPDAMAGPTPVSALIHAATMVTSGIYLLTRLHPLLSNSPEVLFTIATVGVGTAFIAAIMACFQSDIKKILAYSTISQLGFMFLGCGVGAFDAGVFHVMTHAFFKALMFLGAGSVIHALHGEQNIFKMGALRKAMPITFVTFTAGWAAILGLPPFSGFFSKDEIIYQSLSSPSGSKAFFVFAALSAFLTAFYMTRLYLLVFFGNSRITNDQKKHLHESPIVMTLPLMVLAVLSLIGGWFGAPYVTEAVTARDPLETKIMILSVCIAVTGALVAYKKYNAQAKEEPVKDVFGIDRGYGIIFGSGTMAFARSLNRYIENLFIQNSLKLGSAVVELSGNLIRVTQTGSSQGYLLMIVFGVIATLIWFVFSGGHYGRI